FTCMLALSVALILFLLLSLSLFFLSLSPSFSFSQCVTVSVFWSFVCFGHHFMVCLGSLPCVIFAPACTHRHIHTHTHTTISVDREQNMFQEGKLIMTMVQDHCCWV